MTVLSREIHSKILHLILFMILSMRKHLLFWFFRLRPQNENSHIFWYIVYAIIIYDCDTRSVEDIRNLSLLRNTLHTRKWTMPCSSSLITRISQISLFTKPCDEWRQKWSVQVLDWYDQRRLWMHKQPSDIWA